MDDATRRILDGTTWAEFCDTLRAAGAVVLGEGTPDDPFDRAEGFRYLSRLLRSALESFVENSDAEAPELRRTERAPSRPEGAVCHARGSLSTREIPWIRARGARRSAASWTAARGPSSATR